MDPIDIKYLCGEMPACKAACCDRPSQNRDVGYCTRCWIKIQQHQYANELKEAKNALTRSWYFIPKHFREQGKQVFVCLTCEATYDVATTEKSPTETIPPTPIIGCCVQTLCCAAAQKFWGFDNPVPAEILKKYKDCPLPFKSGHAKCFIPDDLVADKQLYLVADKQLYDTMYDIAKRYKDNPQQAILDAAKVNALTKQAIDDVANGR